MQALAPPQLVRVGTRYNFPSDLGAFSIAFAMPECLRELGSIIFSLIFKALVVIIETDERMS